MIDEKKLYFSSCNKKELIEDKFSFVYKYNPKQRIIGEYLLNIYLHLFMNIKLSNVIKMKNIISVQTLHLHINQIAKIAICGINLTVFCTRHQL